MRLIRLLVLPLFCLLVSVVHAQCPGCSRALIIAYVFPQNTLLTPGSVDAAHLSRINYAFANIQDGRMVEGFPQDTANLAYLTSLKQQNPGLRVLVSVGGWLWSGNFSAMAMTAASRAVFIDSVVDYIARHQLDGLDIDWEYPGMAGATNHFRPDDGEHFLALITELRARFNQEQDKTSHPLYLSIAAGSSDDYLAHTPLNTIAPLLDTVNLMAYDYYEPSDDKTTGNHAPLHTDPRDPKAVSAAASVRAFEKAGVPADKLVLGVPFYGHVWGDVPTANHGLFEPGRPVPDAYAGYGGITTTMLGHGFTRYWDAAAGAPYLYSEQKREFVSYDDPESLRIKSEYVLSHHLAGVMFWDYTGDPTGELLRTLAQALNGPQQ